MKKLLLLAAGAALLVYSCGKRYDNPNVVNTFKTYPSLDSVFSELSLKPKYVSLDAATGGSFYGNSGTKYTFPANAFQTGSGASVTGNVQIAVTEYLKRGDMIFSQMLPISDGQPLISAGQVDVRATQGGAEIFIKPGMTYTIDIPQGGTPVPGMQIFRGRKVVPITNRSMVNWRFGGIDSSGSGSQVSVVYKEDTLSLILDSMNFINGDKYRRDSNGSTQNIIIDVTALGKQVALSNYRGYIMVGAENSVFGMYSTSGTTVMNLSLNKYLFHFVTVALIDGKYFGGITTATPEAGKTYTINMVEVDPIAFKAQLNALYN